MVKPLFDTSILVDFLGGVPEAHAELHSYDDWAISIVTWIEVMASATEPLSDATRRFLASFEVLPIDGDVAEMAVALRKARRLNIPDALVQATASVHSRLLVTLNEKTFPAKSPGVRIPYNLRLRRFAAARRRPR